MLANIVSGKITWCEFCSGHGRSLIQVWSTYDFYSWTTRLGSQESWCLQARLWGRCLSRPRSSEMPWTAFLLASWAQEVWRGQDVSTKGLGTDFWPHLLSSQRPLAWGPPSSVVSPLSFQEMPSSCTKVRISRAKVVWGACFHHIRIISESCRMASVIN